jgi:receptor protein-tyrosine kinase
VPVGRGRDKDEEGARPSVVAITAGRSTPRPAELLGSQRFAAFVDQVREAYDVVILDATPLLAVGDALSLVGHADGLLMCIRSARTTRDQARAAKAALGHLPERPTGVVVTGVPHGGELDYGYYGYAYAYGSA